MTTTEYFAPTYFEILFTPVRNFVFFFHIVAGVLIAMGATAISRFRPIVSLVLGLGAAFFLVAAVRWGSIWSTATGWFFGTLVFVYTISLVFVPSRKKRLTHHYGKWAWRISTSAALCGIVLTITEFERNEVNAATVNIR